MPILTAADLDDLHELQPDENRPAVDFEIELDESRDMAEGELRAIVDSILLRVDSGERDGVIFDADGQPFGWFRTV